MLLGSDISSSLVYLLDSNDINFGFRLADVTPFHPSLRVDNVIISFHLEALVSPPSLIASWLAYVDR
jgi:hypothetical protein